MNFDLYELTGLEPALLIYAILVTGVAAFIRGYSGFGFSALMVSSLSIFLAPSEVVPIAFLLEIAASIHMLPLVWREIDWKSLKWLSTGAFLGTPIGLFFLTEIPQKPMRLLISVLIFVVSLLLLKNFRLLNSPSWKGILGVGTFSGLVNGTAAIGGLPVVLFFLSSSAGASLSRASMVAYLFFTDVYAVMLSGSLELLSAQILIRSVLFLFPLTIGIWLGHRSFVSASPESFRKFAIVLLMALSSVGIIKAIIGF